MTRRKPPHELKKRGRPLLPDAMRHRPGITIRPPADVWREVQRLAAYRGIGAGHWVVEAIIEKLKRGKT